ncbi:MAG: VOC family protein [Gammaproteobacteria bacterium]|nr:VOC family protein [Gammaproteobacteria bacterium]
MFSHIMLGANNIQESKALYDAILGVLGHGPGTVDKKGRCFYFTEEGIFALSLPIDGEPACCGNGSTIGFAAKSAEAVDGWFRAGLASGGTSCEGEPSWLEGRLGKVYRAYLRDPSANKICALYRTPEPKL